MSEKNKVVIEETKQWIKNIVIGNNFCPFAANPYNQNRIRYSVSDAVTEASLIEDVINELIYLRDVSVEDIETSFLIAPNCFDTFGAYNQFLSLVDHVLENLQLEGVVQVASFHPDYRFADLSQDDVRNYTNRSIYPMFHFIREESVERARTVYPDVDNIPELNMAKLLSLGLNRITKQISSCHLTKK